MEHDLSVQDVLQHFNERDRYYIQQIIINGEAVTKIAQQQNLTSSGVHSHLRRIKKKMREVLNESIL
jgi:DNA-directed RNA polymerase specialized sigma24 family protein